jgi:plastocyanin
MAGKATIRIVIALVAIAALAVAVTAGGAAAGKAAPFAVSAEDDFFDPEKAAIGQGEKVKWTNNGSEDHTVKFKGDKDVIIAPGESYSRKFKDTGKFKYHCTLHAGMTGKVVAKDVR